MQVGAARALVAVLRRRRRRDRAGRQVVQLQRAERPRRPGGEAATPRRVAAYNVLAAQGRIKTTVRGSVNWLKSKLSPSYMRASNGNAQARRQLLHIYAYIGVTASAS